MPSSNNTTSSSRWLRQDAYHSGRFWPCISKNFLDYPCNHFAQSWRNRVANLVVLFCAISLKEVIIRKRLQPGSFAHRKAATLSWIRMNEIVAILGNVCLLYTSDAADE